MKTKRKPEMVLERIGRFLYWVFLEDDEMRYGKRVMLGMTFGIRVIAILFSIMIFVLVVYSIPAQPLPHERYQTVYDECMVADALTAEQCHDIALAAVGDG